MSLWGLRTQLWRLNVIPLHTLLIITIVIGLLQCKDTVQWVLHVLTPN